MQPLTHAAHDLIGSGSPRPDQGFRLSPNAALQVAYRTESRSGHTSPMATEQIAVRLPEPLLSDLDDLVKTGAYESRAAATGLPNPRGTPNEYTFNFQLDRRSSPLHRDRDGNPDHRRRAVDRRRFDHGVSRMYVEAHLTADIAAGWDIGALAGRTTRHITTATTETSPLRAHINIERCVAGVVKPGSDATNHTNWTHGSRCTRQISATDQAMTHIQLARRRNHHVPQLRDEGRTQRDTRVRAVSALSA